MFVKFNRGVSKEGGGKGKAYLRVLVCAVALCDPQMCLTFVRKAYSKFQFTTSFTQLIISFLQFVTFKLQCAISNLQLATSKSQYVISISQFVVSKLQLSCGQPQFVISKTGNVTSKIAIIYSY